MYTAHMVPSSQPASHIMLAQQFLLLYINRACQVFWEHQQGSDSQTHEHTNTDRQTDKQTDGQMETDRQMDGQTKRRIRRTDHKSNMLTDRLQDAPP